MVWAKHHCLSPPLGIIGNHFIRSEPDKILGAERILAMDLPTHSGEVLL